MTVKFYSKDDSDSIELIPDYQDCSVRILAKNEDDEMIAVIVSLDNDDVHDFCDSLYNMIKKVETEKNKNQ